jgi:flagellar hook-basal body complex protein FliE
MAIESVIGAIQPAILNPEASPVGEAAPGFGSALGRLVSSVEETNATANKAIGKMVDGGGDVHDAMIALQRAEMTLQLTVQVRNKLVQAYQDIMRMPV